MGVCQSCLGRRDSNAFQSDEDTGLLYDDANGIQYGSFGDHAVNGESDTVEVQRENEAIQHVISRTSNNMVDVFEIAPPPGIGRGSSSNFAYAGQGARLARYQHLVSKLSADEDSPPSGIKVGWLADDDTIEMQGNKPASLNTGEAGDDALVGTFADAAAAAAAATTSAATET